MTIENFRNFSKPDAALAGRVDLAGENKVGKCILMHALRLQFDASLPDDVRDLGQEEFRDGVGGPGRS